MNFNEIRRQLAAQGFRDLTDDDVKRMLVRTQQEFAEHVASLERARRWLAFTDEEIRTIYVEMVTDDGIRYGYSEGDEPACTIYRELIAEIKCRGIDEII